MKKKTKDNVMERQHGEGKKKKKKRRIFEHL